MNRPVRKVSRLAEYDYSAAGYYFLTICTEKRKNILCSLFFSEHSGKVVGDGALDVPCFASNDDLLYGVKTELTDIGRITEKYIISSNKLKNVLVDNYVIMPNHIHIIVRILNPSDNAFLSDGFTCNGEKNISYYTNKIIPHFVSTLKRLIYKECGVSVFQRSYYDRIIRNENEYRTVNEYIANNPAKWADDEYFIL